jgi:ammonia channel protein AmtB
MIGGTAGFIGAWILGPRVGKEKDKATRKSIKEDPEYQTFKANLNV